MKKTVKRTGHGDHRTWDGQAATALTHSFRDAAPQKQHERIRCTSCGCWAKRGKACYHCGTVAKSGLTNSHNVKGTGSPIKDAIRREKMQQRGRGVAGGGSSSARGSAAGAGAASGRKSPKPISWSADIVASAEAYHAAAGDDDSGHEVLQAQAAAKRSLAAEKRVQAEKTAAVAEAARARAQEQRDEADALVAEAASLAETAEEKKGAWVTVLVEMMGLAPEKAAL